MRKSVEGMGGRTCNIGGVEGALHVDTGAFGEIEDIGEKHEDAPAEDGVVRLGQPPQQLVHGAQQHEVAFLDELGLAEFVHAVLQVCEYVLALLDRLGRETAKKRSLP